MKTKWKLKKTVGPKVKVPRVPKEIDPSVDPKYLAWLRKFPCAVHTYALSFATPCRGIVEAHHHTSGRGKSQQSDDRRAFPLCARHHRAEFHDGHGTFEDWGKVRRREWQDRMSRQYRWLYQTTEAA